MHYPIHFQYTYRRLLVDRFYNKLLVIEGDVSDFTPGETNLWSQSGKKRNILRDVAMNSFSPHYF